MRNNAVLRLWVEAKQGSVLQQAIAGFLKERNKTRHKLQKEYDKNVEKQIKKFGHSGL
jgi:hypothetical protein